MHFSTELQNTEVSITLLKSDPTTDALTAIFISLGTKEAFSVESVFGIVIGGEIGQLEFLKRYAIFEILEHPFLSEH